MEVLISCLVGLAQNTVDTFAPKEVTDYGRVRDAVLKNLNLSPEAYRRRLQEVSFGTYYHPKLVAQNITVAGLSWLCPAVQTAG